MDQNVVLGQSGFINRERFVYLKKLFTFYLFVRTLFSITYGEDAPKLVTGLLAIAGLISYPFYILILNFFGLIIDENMIKINS